ncbi:MAG: molybdopterin-guanine dinucleotide biosynthesis protein B [Thermoleophilia bacterium]|nr:molybdopterin-guanine dinucleotide biosynthesis protein B [Thermoleophilia bacterium]
MSSPSPEGARPIVVRVSGPHSNVGKTTLIERIIPAIADRGLRVGTIKHTHHGFDLDHPGKDSDRHRVAGAVATVLVGPSSTATLLHDHPRIGLDEAVGRIAEHVDVVLAEGFRSASGFAIHLDPAQDERLTHDASVITIGVLPDELEAAELARIVDACLESSREL